MIVSLPLFFVASSRPVLRVASTRPPPKTVKGTTAISATLRPAEKKRANALSQ